MTTPEETDFKCKARVAKEDATGAIVESIKLVDLNTLFHPLEGSVKAQTTEFIVKVDGVDTDLNEIFEPVASGSKIPMDTKFNVNTTDLRDIFAGKDTIPAALKLQQLPRGDFTCDTYLKLYYDRSGSMEDSFPYIDKAVAALKSWFSKTFYGDTAAGRALAQQYVTVMNPAKPWEQTMTWIAAAVDNRTAGREVSIAYINESDSGGTGHPGSSKEYAKRWKALTNAGGCKHAAIMGVWHPWFRYYPGQLKAQLNQVIFEGKALKDMNVSGFFDIQDHTPTSEHVEIIANWLNIPTKPEHLTIVVNAFESDEHKDKVQWTLSSEICGLTHVPGADPAAFTKTQKCWKIEVKDENDLIVDTVTDLYMRPETHTYTTTNDQNPMTDFYCRLTAVGETGYGDKVGEWVLCKKISVVPQEIYEKGVFWLTQISQDNIFSTGDNRMEAYSTVVVADPTNGTTLSSLPGPFATLPANKYSLVARQPGDANWLASVAVGSTGTDWTPPLHMYTSVTSILPTNNPILTGTTTLSESVDRLTFHITVDDTTGALPDGNFRIDWPDDAVMKTADPSSYDENKWITYPAGTGKGEWFHNIKSVDGNKIIVSHHMNGAGLPVNQWGWIDQDQDGDGKVDNLQAGQTVKFYKFGPHSFDITLTTLHADKIIHNSTTGGYPKRGKLKGQLMLGNPFNYPATDRITMDPNERPANWVYDDGLLPEHKQWLTETYIDTTQWVVGAGNTGSRRGKDPWSGLISIYAIIT